MEVWPGVNHTLHPAPTAGLGGAHAAGEWPGSSQSGVNRHSGNISAASDSNHSSGEGGGGGGSKTESGSAALQAYYEQLLAHPDIRMRDELFRYVTPVLIVYGNFSNVLALLVLRRNGLRQHSVCFYMAAYAVSNILVLDLILGIEWLCFMLEKNHFEGATDWGCRLWTFISNVIIYCGIWFVVVLSIDRFIYLCYARKAKSYCKVFAAKGITIMVVFGLVIVSIHAMWTYELLPQGCYVSIGQDDLHTKIWPLWSATVYTYLPLTLLLFIIIVLSVSLCLKRHRQRRAESAPGGGPEDDDFTVTTLVLASAYFLLTVPATVINVVDIYLPSTLLSLDLIAQIELAKRITAILNSANHTLLGLVLLILSRAFRLQLYAMLTSFRLKRRPKVYEMASVASDRGAAGDGGSGSSSLGGGVGADSSGGGVSTATPTTTNGRTSSGDCHGSRNHIEYEVCNSNDLSTEITTV